jgi:hypothetical protein
MRLLFVAFILSMCALLGAALFIARHIRRHGAAERRGPGNDVMLPPFPESMPNEGFKPAGGESGMHATSTTALNSPHL